MRNSLIVVVAALALAAAACGDSAEKDDSEDSTTTTAAAVASELDQFLVRANEVPGLSPAGEPGRLPSLIAYDAAFNLSDADEQRLKANGFQSSVEVRLEGESSDGLSSVDLYATADGAAAELAYIVGNKQATKPVEVTNLTQFAIPGVPTAVGWTFDKPNGDRTADVHWTQGRCLLTLGQQPVAIDDLRAGVKALFDRTGGKCP